ncbi:MAG: cyclic nucleotide-binding domain-containing protein [Gammaproteobacteria bacterium]|nr:cyclic nucleotide-binding domain-containing protein [Gammaproteobacteria bacterium]NNF60922.1 cyclic nucleotide-binding domain-containing protein [Gammaproteobacteria bacterium]NNM21900.1 cyclic nucleotide-binding domain-containing protein [Gammaproteobacteria bacterium]
MQEALSFLNQLSDDDIESLFELGSEQQTITNTVILKEGEVSPTLYIVLEGLVGVSTRSLPDRQLATLGPGELVGEISFLEQKPAIATVTIVENTLLLAIPADALREAMERRAGFGSRMYRSLALLAAQRLRNQVSALGRWVKRSEKGRVIDDELFGKIASTVDDFKQLMRDCDTQALQNDGEVPQQLRQKALADFSELTRGANQILGQQSELGEAVANSLGARFQQEFLPYLLLTRTAERFYSKPRGYAGDFLTIEMIYENSPSGTSRIGPLLDECFLREPAATAVQNRRGLLCDEIEKAMRSDGPTRVTSMASGPAAELFDVYKTLESPENLKASCIDIDLQALAFVSDRRDQRKLRQHMDLLNCNLVYLALGRQELNLANQDLAYSIGLIDYFADKFVIELLNYVHGILREGGKVILGNFHPRNSSRATMDHVLDWKLIHRTEDDMHRLFKASKFARPCDEIRYEEQRVNLFASCIKQ